MRKEDACGSDRGCESPLKTGQHRNINNAQYTKGAKNPEKLHATASLEDADGNENLVEPDISVICDPEKIDEKGCHGAPNWVIEIVLPSSKSIDYGRKQALYLLSGVREYWIVDPIRESAVIYRAAEDWIPMFYRFGDSLKAGIYEDLEIVIE